VLTAFGLWLFGFDRAVLWGLVAAFGALIPGVGTMIVFVPALIYLAFSGMYVQFVGVAVWGAVAVGLIDNFLGPYLMSRGNSMHPFLILLSVLGGIATFGPIGFIVGPVIMSLFKVLLELYSIHLSDQKQKAIKTS
jgi:predicted PurR-regulated permease PerM